MRRFPFPDQRNLVLLAAFLLILLANCGRKAPPVWLEPESLPPPHSLDAVFREDEVKLKWQFPSEMMAYLNGFMVQRGREGAFTDYALVREQSFTDRKPGGYSYRVAAISSRKKAELNYSGEVSSPHSSELEPPKGLRAAATAEGLRIEWDRGTVARGFNVYRKSGAGDGLEGPLNIRPLEEPFYIDNGFTSADKGPVYVVRAMRNSQGAGNMSTVEGPASVPLEIDAAMLMPAAPTGVDIAQSGGKVLVYWDISPEKWVDGYRVYRREGERGQLAPITRTITPAYSEIIPAGTAIGYAVSAFWKDVEGPVSPTVWVKSPSSK